MAVQIPHSASRNDRREWCRTGSCRTRGTHRYSSLNPAQLESWLPSAAVPVSPSRRHCRDWDRRTGTVLGCSPSGLGPCQLSQMLLTHSPFPGRQQKEPDSWSGSTDATKTLLLRRLSNPSSLRSQGWLITTFFHELERSSLAAERFSLPRFSCSLVVFTALNCYGISAPQMGK